VAEPATDLRAREQRPEARLGVAVLPEHLERLLDKRLRGLDVGAQVELDVAERVESAPVDVALARGRGGRPDFLHLAGERDHVAEPPGGAGGEVAAYERRGELDGAEQELARAAERLAGERALAGVREGDRGLLGQLRRRLTVQLGEQPRGLVEMEGADLDELVAGAGGQPL